MSSIAETADVSCGILSRPEAARSRTHCLSRPTMGLHRQRTTSEKWGGPMSSQMTTLRASSLSSPIPNKPKKAYLVTSLFATVTWHEEDS